MRYLIASDIHGSLYSAKKIIDIFNNGSFDKIILLGDIYYHGPRNPFPKEYNPKEVALLFNKYKDKIICIKGNCDSEVDQMISDFKFQSQFTLVHNNKRIFFTHGHKYNIDIYPKTNFDVMFYGHFHKKFIIKKNNKTFVNPGSASLPKDDNILSYCILDDNITICNIENSEILLCELF